MLITIVLARSGVIISKITVLIRIRKKLLIDRFKDTIGAMFRVPTEKASAGAN